MTEYICSVTLDQLTDIIDEHVPSNPNIVYKSCGNYIVVLKKLENTITNENRCGIVDSNHAKFRANTLMTILIINKMNGQLVTKITNSCYSKKIFLYELNKIAIVNDYDMHSNIICAPGIHYFKSIESAYFYDFKNIETHYTGTIKKWLSDGYLYQEYELLNGHMVSEKYLTDAEIREIDTFIAIQNASTALFV